MSSTGANIKIRSGRPEDGEPVVAVLAAVAPEGSLGVEPPVDADKWATRIRELALSAPPAGLWILEDGKDVLGYASVSETTGGVLVLAMAMLPSARGQGHGRALIEKAVSHGSAAGAHKLTLEVWTDNARAIALYARSGFEVEGVRRDHYRRRDGSLRSAVIMARRLQ